MCSVVNLDNFTEDNYTDEFTPLHRGIAGQLCALDSEDTDFPALWKAVPRATAPVPSHP